MDAKQQYLKELESTLDVQRELLSRLQQRVKLLSEQKPESEFEENENAIQIIKSNAEIGALQHIIREKHDYFVKYAASIGNEIIELDQKFDAVYNKALEQADSNEVLKRLVRSIDIDKLKTHKESKLYLYNKLMSLINE
jgi:hypothetical protein